MQRAARSRKGDPPRSSSGIHRRPGTGPAPAQPGDVRCPPMSVDPPADRSAHVMQVETLDRLLEALRGRGFLPIGPTVAPRGDRLRRDRLDRRPARGLDRRAGRRPLPARAPRRRGAVRLQRRPALVEALPVPAHADAVDGAPPRRRRARRSTRSASRARRATPSSACARATCTRSRVQDRVFLDGRVRRPRLRGAPRGRVHRRGELRRRRAAPASARRWAPARGRAAASTSR